jgi:hypothetical protein
MSPFYTRLPNVAGVNVEHTADVIGLGLAAGAAAGVLTHAVATQLHQIRTRRQARAGPAEPPTVDGGPRLPPQDTSAGGKKEETHGDD